MSRTDSFSTVLTITEPQAGTSRSTEQIDVFGYAMDDSGIMAIRVDGNDLFDAPQFASERGRRLVHFGFRGQARGEGRLTYLIEVDDSDGNTTTLDYSITVDVTPPTLELETTALGDGAFNISGTARDNNVISSIRIGGVPFSFAPGPEVNFDLQNIRPETREIEVIDAAGNTLKKEF